MSDNERQHVIRLPIGERGWRIGLLYAVGVVLLLLGGFWLNAHRNVRYSAEIAMAAAISVFILWHLLGGVRIVLLTGGVAVYRWGLLGKPTYIPYSSIVSVHVPNDGTAVGLVIVERNGMLSEIGPWEPYWSALFRRRIEDARKEIEAGVERSRE